MYPEIALGEFIDLDVDAESVDPDKTYTTAGIYSYGRGLFRRATILGSETKYSRYTKLHEGQFVYSKLFGWEGALATVEKEFDGLYVSHEFPTFTIKATVADLSYVRHLARWEGLHAKLRDKGTGMGSRRQRVNIDRLLATTVPLPDVEEQRRIAARLDSTTQRLSLVRESRERADQLNNAIKDSIIHQEEASPLTRLGDILTLERIPLDIDSECEYTQIGIRSFGNGIFHRDKLPGRELSKLKYFWIQPDRLVVSNIMAWEGAIAISTDADQGCVGSSRFLSFIPSDNTDLRYLNYYFQSGSGRSIVRNTSTGTVLRNQTISVSKFENICIPLPDLPKQQQVANFLDECALIGRAAQAQLPTASALRQSFLHAAFSGEL
ncbi:restriction endonuclease subunit S [Actinomadura sp. BRA 177]|uniref:restriction endonuclease subunit S n=1 Tax=Actinomadura sp. BRA 177 TaxID=2745202 RepID=UPI0020CBFE5A|nr:restriction endonuclease subunit S [Actinomadura sp. BRA 177]